jgi:hypothetical protein
MPQLRPNKIVLLLILSSKFCFERYKYAFETLGTDVKITLNCWYGQTGVVAYLRNKVLLRSATRMFLETYLQNYMGQTAGSTINYAVKLFLLPVEECRLLNTFLCSGSNCALSIESSSELKQFYFPNPVGTICICSY